MGGQNRQGQDLSSQLGTRFGRAKLLIVVDTDTYRFEVHDNTVNLNASSGAGIQTAQNVANLGAEAVITGNKDIIKKLIRNESLGFY